MLGTKMVRYSCPCICGVNLLVAVVLLFAVHDVSALRPKRVDYEYFDEYLLNIKLPEEHAHNQVLTSRKTVIQRTTDDEELQDGGSGDADAEDIQDKEAFRANTANILGYFRDVPREHWSCCMLGKLAGDKGFHCHAGFYQARITARNYNRAHNKKMHFYGRSRIPNWGTSIMRTFRRCVAKHANEFHKCCYAAGVEQRERNRWRYYRQQSHPTTTTTTTNSTTTLKPKIVDTLRQFVQLKTSPDEQRRPRSGEGNRRSEAADMHRRTRTDGTKKRSRTDNPHRSRTEGTQRRVRTGVAHHGHHRTEHERRVRTRVHSTRKHRATSRGRTPEASRTQEAMDRIRQMTREQGTMQ